MPNLSPDAPIGVFDSGVGGLSVLKALVARLPHEDILYSADRAHHPYGSLSTDKLLDVSRAQIDTLLSRGAKLIVIACNTATAAASERLRQEYAVHIVGTEPAVKAVTDDADAYILCTQATARQEKFLRLKQEHAPQAKIVTFPTLATEIERAFFSPEALLQIAAATAAQVPVGARIVLGCTHYVFLQPYLSTLRPDLKLYDSCDGVSRRVEQLLIRGNLLSSRSTRGRVETICSAPSQTPFYDAATRFVLTRTD